ncbi:hypothetical protein, partial [Plasmodium yoelii yoelii]
VTEEGNHNKLFSSNSLPSPHHFHPYFFSYIFRLDMNLNNYNLSYTYF